MTTYTPELADEVLVMGPVHTGGVGTVTDIGNAGTDAVEIPKYFIEGTLPNGDEFTRWYPAEALTPAVWGTWYVAVRAAGVTYVSAEYTAAPIPPVEAVLEQVHGAPFYIIEGDPGFDGYSASCPPRRAIATAHIETVEVVTIDRRDSR